jgi:2-dehydropantoate 2-reductase
MEAFKQSVVPVSTGYLLKYLLVHNSILNVTEGGLQPFDFIVVTTKNIADVSPSVAEIIAPAVTPRHTSIVLLQNGLNIEKPLLTAFPTNPILSGVSLIGATETSAGVILHDDRDRLIIGAFINPNIPLITSTSSAKRFVELYSASGKVSCTYDENVGFVRWRKLVYNACYNSACAITHMDTARMRILKYPIEDVVKPLMIEIVAIAKAAGHVLPEGIVESMIHCDPEDTYFKPSMQQDIEKVRLLPLFLLLKFKRRTCGEKTDMGCLGQLYGI